ncbi:unnamed protein product [Toxocara canis]|uniref:Glucosamine 6-phosphate N-acetyltransferase n=1 Tax=Toxocara canis TaxID=6265 RepID=A0A183UQC2_TOXCA|nr:unnamed protein product [Toxocara canis]
MKAVAVNGDSEKVPRNIDRLACFRGEEQKAIAVHLNNNCLYQVDKTNEATEMFPSDLLLSLELPLSAPKLPEDLMIRPLRIDDYNRGYLQLLSQLTSVGDVSEEQFQKRFVSMQNTHPKGYYVVVLEEPRKVYSSGMIVGSATLVIEWKFIHEAGCRGRTEDVVVDKRMRGRQLGKILNFYLVQLARRIGVYKLSLECKDALIPFYEQFGFKLDQGNNFLVQRFK